MNRKKIPIYLLAVLPILIAVFITVALVRNRKGPEQLSARENIRAVRMIEIQPIDVTPRAIGYGYVRPARFWQAVAEVSGWGVLGLTPSPLVGPAGNVEFLAHLKWGAGSGLDIDTAIELTLEDTTRPRSKT